MRQAKSWKIAHKLFLGMVLFTALGLIAALLVTHTVVRTVVYGNVLESAQRDREILATQLDAWFAAAENIIDNLGDIMPLAYETDYLNIMMYFVDRHDFIETMWIYFQDGTLVTTGTWRPPAEFVATDREWWLLAEERSGEVITTMPYVSAASGEIVTTIAKHTYNWQGQQAVIAMNISMEQIYYMVSEYRAQAEGYIMLIGPGGEIKVHQNRELMPMSEEFYLMADIEEYNYVFSRFLAGEDIVRHYCTHGYRCYYMQFRLPASGWTMVSIVPATVTSEPVRQTLLTVSLSIIAALVLNAAFLFVFLRKGFIKPVETLTKNVGVITTDDLTGTLEFDARNLRRSDEIGDLSNALSQMLAEINTAREKERDAELEDRTNFIVESSPSAVIMLDKNLRTIDCNGRALQMYGVKDKETFMRGIHNLAYIVHDDNAMESFNKHLETALLEGHSVLPEFSVKKANGTPFFIESTLIRIPYKNDVAVIEYSRDITEEKRAREKEREAHEMMRTMVEMSPFPCIVFNESGNIVEANKATLTMLGIPEEKATSEQILEMSPELQPCGTPSNIKMANELAKSFSGVTEPFIWLHKAWNTGELIHIELTSYRVDTPKGVLLITYGRDMREHYELLETRKKELEAEQRERELEKQLLEQSVIERIHLVIDAAPFSVVICTEDRYILDCNAEAAKMFKFNSREELIAAYNERFFDYFAEVQTNGIPAREMLDNSDKLLSENGIVTNEWIYVDNNGSPFPAEVTIVRAKHRDSYMLFVYARDLTEEKATQQRERDAYEMMKQNELEKLRLEQDMVERIQLVMDAAPFSVVICDENRHILNCNAEAARMFKFNSREELIAARNERPLDYFAAVQPGGVPLHEALINSYKEMMDKGIATMEMIYVDNKGGQFPAESTMVRAKHRDSYMFFIYARDLTEEKAAQQREREAHQMMNVMVDATPMFIEIWDSKGDLIQLNEQCVELFGLSHKNEFIEKYEQLSPPFQPCGTPSVEKNQMMLEKVRREGYSRTEWLHLNTRGEEVPVETIGVRLKQRDEYIVVCYNYDLRPIKHAQEEQKRYEVAEESNRAKSAFLARMSHEIRTPITAVLGISEIELQNPNLSVQTEESFSKIHSSANMLLNIVNDILDLSKIEANKMDMAAEEYEVASVITDSAQLHIGLLSSRNIKFSLYVDENLPARLIGDALRIGQIINNVLSNAFKYTQSGSVDLFFERGGGVNGDYAVMSVTIRDTGFGMTEEQIKALSGEYTRFHEREHRYISGTGLGMPIVYNLVKLMGAEIEVSSEVNVGTTVIVRIPQKMAGSELLGKETASRLQQFEESIKTVAKKFAFEPEPMPYGKVLVVDDVEANLYIAKGLMAFYDLRVETCDNGLSAIEKIKQGRSYDLILMDYMMPGMNGTEAMRQIRETGYTRPIVALTANAMFGQAEAFIKDGFDGFISKPIKTKALNTILNRHIRDKQPPEVIRSALARRGLSINTAAINNFQADAAVVEKLRNDFVRNHKDICKNVLNAAKENDYATAHFLAHTLKGVAGLIHEQLLSELAMQMELAFAAEEMPQSEALAEFEREFYRVLSAISLLETADTHGGVMYNQTEALAVLDRLEPELARHSVTDDESITELEKIPGSFELRDSIEKYDFRRALKALKKLRQTLQ